MNQDHFDKLLEPPSREPGGSRHPWNDFVASQGVGFVADLSNADLQRVRLCRNSNLAGADLSGADLRKARMDDVDLRGADLSETLVSDTSLIAAELSNANLTGADFTQARLFEHVTLAEANLSGATFDGAKLTQLNLAGTNLTGTSLVGADLSLAKLVDAHLEHTDLSQADLRGTLFAGAHFEQVILAGAVYDENTHWPIGFDPSSTGALLGEPAISDATRFEVHLTLAGGTDLEILRRVADELEVKMLHIVLERGDHPSQPMVSFHGTGDVEGQLLRAASIEKEMHSKGLTVTRTKVECEWGATLARGDRTRKSYHEFHIKVRLDDESPSLDRLEAIVSPRGAHLSTNAIFKDVAEEHRFVTLRSTRRHRFSDDEFLLLLHVIKLAGFAVLKTEREVVLYDSNMSIDDGWLPSKQAPIPPREERIWPKAFELTPTVDRPKLFDPALAHYQYGFTKGAPAHVDEQWHAARQQIFAALLQSFAASDLNDKLVARGSVLMSHMIGAESRRPADIDWVVYPAAISMDSDDGIALFDAAQQIVRHHERIGDATLHLDQLASDSIWTYDRVPGRRITVPWSVPGKPTGTIQLDFVFEEQLWLPPVRVAFDGFAADASLLTASPEQSLAWKLMWLATDNHPQGKDLYDAVLLAERYPIGSELFFRAVTSDYEKGWSLGPNHEWFGPDLPMRWAIDWGNFIEEYPHVGPDADPWKQRLCDALRPGFGDMR